MERSKDPTFLLWLCKAFWSVLFTLNAPSQGEGVVFPHCFSSREVSQVSAVPGSPPGPGRGAACGGSAGREHGNYHSPQLPR